MPCNNDNHCTRALQADDGPPARRSMPARRGKQQSWPVAPSPPAVVEAPLEGTAVAAALVAIADDFGTMVKVCGACTWRLCFPHWLVNVTDRARGSCVQAITSKGKARAKAPKGGWSALDKRVAAACRACDPDDKAEQAVRELSAALLAVEEAVHAALDVTEVRAP